MVDSVAVFARGLHALRASGGGPVPSNLTCERPTAWRDGLSLLNFISAVRPGRGLAVSGGVGHSSSEETYEADGDIAFGTLGFLV